MPFHSYPVRPEYSEVGLFVHPSKPACRGPRFVRHGRRLGSSAFVDTRSERANN